MSVKACVVLLATLVGCREPRRSDANRADGGPAFYLTAKVEPTDTTIYGIPLRQLDTSWARAQLSAHGVIVSDSGQRAFADSMVRDAWIDGDFNRDGAVDRAMVGTFRDHKGVTGPFVLVLTQDGGSWRNAFATGMTGTGAVSFLRVVHGDTLVWNDCLDCDAAPIEIVWDGTKYIARWTKE